MSIFKRNVVLAASAGAALLLSACNGVGSGSKPESLRVLPRDGNLATALLDPTAPVAPGKIYTCLRSAMGLYVTFTDGSIGDFSTRANWVSSDETVVRVSSPDKPEPVPDNPGLFYSGGTVIPVAPGSTTLTATYLGMSATLPVNVVQLDLSKLVIEPATAVMAPTTSQTFRLTAEIDQAETDVTQFATFAFAVPDTTVATVDTRATVLAVASGTPMSLEASFTAPDCKRTALVQVAEPTALTIAGEDEFFDPATPTENRLVAGYSEALKVTAIFNGLTVDGVTGDYEQDVSRQFGTVFKTNVTVPADDSDPATPIPTIVSFGSPLLGRGNLMSGVAAGTVEISARFGLVDSGPDEVANTDDDNYKVSTSTPLTRRVVVGAVDPASTATPQATLDPLDSLAIAPATAVIDEACGTQQFKATGSFSPAGAAPTDAVPLVHDISRHVLWSLDAEAIALPDPVVPSQLCSPAATAKAFIDNSGNSLTPGLVRSFLAAGAPEATGIAVTALRVRGSLDSSATAGDIVDLSPTATVDIDPPDVVAAP